MVKTLLNYIPLKQPEIRRCGWSRTMLPSREWRERARKGWMKFIPKSALECSESHQKRAVVSTVQTASSEHSLWGLPWWSRG